MKYFSLFSGIGGFELGIEKATNDTVTTGKQPRVRQKGKSISINKQVGLGTQQFHCIGYSEIDKYAIQIYKTHFPTHKNYGDATRIIPEELPDFDLLCAGFPCQSFSIAGKRGGFEDTRGTLFFEIARIAGVKKPHYLFLENVKGLLSHDKGNTFATILSALDELGYDCQWCVLNSKNFGVPQNRERVFIIGHIRGTSRPKVFPIKGSDREVKRLVYAQKADREIARIYDPKGLAPTLHLKTGGWQEPKIRIDNLHYHRTGEYGNGIHYNITPVLDSGCGRDLAINKIRRLTPTECERLQGFLDGWTEGLSDTQRYKCLGNAVTVNVVVEIVKRLIKNIIPSLPFEG